MFFKKLLKIIKNRYFILGLIITMLFSALGFRLAYLTVDMGPAYYNMAQERKKIDVTLRGARGSILDRNGIPLATNRQIYVAQVDRKWLPAKDDDINEVLLKAIEMIEKNGDKLNDNIPIKYGVKVYDDIIPYTAEGYYYDFGTEDLAVHQKRYDAWRKDAGIKVDLPADQMLDYLRERYKIDDSIANSMARKIVSIRLDLYLNRFKQDEPVKIAEDISAKTVSHIETYADELPGIQTVVEPGRYYPYGTSAQHIIGYVGRLTENNIESYKNKYGVSPADAGYNIYTDKYGQDGIEAYAEKWLTGNTTDKLGYLEAEVDASRRVIKVLEEKAPQNGNDVVLTLDSRLQRVTENILKEELANMRQGLPPYDEKSQAPLAHSAAAVVLDVNTGEILTLASYANSQYTYDLNDFARGITSTEYMNLQNDPSNPMFAIAFQGGMEPGSVFKMLVGTAALMEGKISITDTIYDNHRLRPSAPACWATYSHGSVNVIDALKVSCNYFFTAIGDRLGNEALMKWAVKFGLHGSTGLELLTLDGKTDKNIVANPETMEEIRRKRAITSVRAKLRDAYGKELADGQAEELVEIDLDYGGIVKYLRDNGLFDSKDNTVHNAANDILRIFYEGRWNDFEHLRAFIGQSITSVSPLAVARYIAALVNGGKVLDTHILKEVKTADGNVVETTKPKYTQLEVNEEYTAAIKEGMHRVIYAIDGTAHKAFQDLDPSITLGGKTGTAQVRPGFVEYNTAWFTAFTPYDKPEIAVVVAVPNGKQAGNAAPIARRIIEEYYRLDNRGQQNTLPAYNSITQ